MAETIDLDKVVEEPREEPDIAGGKLKERKSKHRRHHSRKGHQLSFQEHYDRISNEVPYHEYVKEFAKHVNRPENILKHHLHDKYHDFVISRMPDGVIVPKTERNTGNAYTTNKATHRVTAIKSPAKPHRDNPVYAGAPPRFTTLNMVQDYLQGKVPSSLDSDNFVIMNGKVVPKVVARDRLTNVDTGDQLIPRDFYQAFGVPLETKATATLIKAPTKFVDTPKSMLDQRIEVYNQLIPSVMEDTLQLVDLTEMNPSIANSLFDNFQTKFNLDKKNFESYDKIFTMLIRSHGTVVLDTPLSPSFIAYLTLKQLLDNSMNNRFVAIDIDHNVKDAIERTVGKSPNLIIERSLRSLHGAFDTYFIDGTMMSRFSLYKRLIQLWPQSGDRDSKKIIVASRFMLGNSLSDFYKNMGITTFNDLFGDGSRTPSKEVEELYQETLRGYRLTLKADTTSFGFKHGWNTNTQPDSSVASSSRQRDDDDEFKTPMKPSSVSTLTAPSQATTTSFIGSLMSKFTPSKTRSTEQSVETPSSDMNQYVEILRHRKIPIYPADGMTSANKPMPANPNKLSAGQKVIVYDTETQSLISNNGYPLVGIVNRNVRESNSYTVSLPFNVELSDEHRYKLFRVEIGTNRSHDERFTMIDNIAFSRRTFDKDIKSIYDKFYSAYHSSMSFANFVAAYQSLRPDIHDSYPTVINTIDNNGYMHGSALIIRPTTQQVHGGVLGRSERKLRFNPSNITYMFDTTFVNGYPVHVFEITD